MTTASKITLVRVVLIPVYMVLMLLSANGADWLRWAAVAVFVIASISDFLDGYIARHYNQVSDFGKFLDPLADKLLVTACMMIFVGWGRMPSWVVFIVILHDGRPDRHDGAAKPLDTGPDCEYRDFGHDSLFGGGVFLQKLGLPRPWEESLTQA